MASNDTQQIYYEHQYQLYCKMLEIARRQYTLCTTADFSEDGVVANWELLLGNRQELMVQIEKLQSQLLANESDPIPTREDTVAMIQSILEIDKQGQAVFSQKLKDVQIQLRQVQGEKKTTKAYNPYEKQLGGVFIDRKK